MARLYSALEHFSATGCVFRLRDQRHRGIEPAAVRSGGIGTGTCRRVAYRVQLDEVSDVYDGGIRKHDCRRLIGHYSLSRRLEWSDVWTASASDGSADHLVRSEGLGADLLLLIVEIHDSEIPIRSTHEVWLES